MRSLKLKVLLAGLFVGLFVLFGSIVTFLQAGAATRQLRDNVGQALQSLASEMTNSLDRGLFERVRDLDILVELDAIRGRAASRAEQRALFEKLQSTFPDYAWIGLANTRGDVLVSTGGLLEGVNVASRPWFQGALNGPFVGDVHEAKLLATLLPNEGDEPLRFVDVAAPLRDERGRIVGVLGAHLDWAWTTAVRASLLRSVREREFLDVFIVDAAGTVLLGPSALQGATLNLKVLDSGAPASHAVERWPDGGTYVTGVSRSRGYRAYEGLGWRVVVRQHTDVAFAPIRAYSEGAGLAVLVVGVLFALAGMLAAHFIARPLKRLIGAARALEAGELDAAIPDVRAYAEANVLAGALGTLVGTMKRNEQELERRVEERTRSLDARTAEAEALSALSQFSTVDGGSLEMAERIAPVVAEVCALDWIGFTVTTNDETRLVALYALADLPSLPERLGERPPRDDVEVSRVRTARRDEVYADDYEAQSWAHPELIECGVRSAAFVPLAGRDPYGVVLVAARRAVRSWSDVDRRVLAAAARAVEIRVERHEHLQDLEQAALHDKLTGLGNRRAFDRDLDAAVNAARRHGHGFGVMIADLDGLKRINDTLGHERGDAVLREFARALRASFRREDRVFRLGGDEYALILDRATAPHVRSVLEGVRGAVRDVRAAGFEEMDASAGVAFYPTDATDGTSLVRLADERMYEDKSDHALARRQAAALRSRRGAP